MQIFGSDPERMAEAARMVVDAGADIVDINFGCPVRKVTKTGAGASALSDHDLACGIAGAVADAVDVPVTAKMRRGRRERLARRARARPAGSRRSAWRRSRSTRARRKQMYTGTADHALTAELVERVSVPVIASGDIVDRASAERVLDSTGAAAVMVGRGAQGQPWTLQEMAERGAEAPEPGEVVAELIRFMREVEREMGDRAVELPAQVLRLVPARHARREVREAASSRPRPTVAEAEAALLRFCPEARARLAGHEAELALLPDSDSDRLLDLPISIYGGG